MAISVNMDLSWSKLNSLFLKCINSFKTTPNDFLKLHVVVWSKTKPLYTHSAWNSWKQLFWKVHGVRYSNYNKFGIWLCRPIKNVVQHLWKTSIRINPGKILDLWLWVVVYTDWFLVTRRSSSSMRRIQGRSSSLLLLTPFVNLSFSKFRAFFQLTLCPVKAS